MLRVWVQSVRLQSSAFLIAQICVLIQTDMAETTRLMIPTRIYMMKLTEIIAAFMEVCKMP